MENMNSLCLFGLLCLASGCYGVCRERYSGKMVQEGGTVMRSKPMGQTTLIGTYTCNCESGGRLICSAFDIPCYDVTRKMYVAKGNRFHAHLGGKINECTCMGGRGRFENCRSVVSQGGSLGCPDILLHRTVNTGDSYYTRNFGITLKCLCDNGRPARGSCKRARGIVIDPCRTATCHYSASCISQGNSYTCQCKSGYEGSGRQCRDVDECTTGSARCDIEATCMNTIGSYTCACKTGFMGDGFHCTTKVVDPCISGIWSCDVHAECIPNAETYTCRCIDGYEGNGFTCTDVDECTSSVSQCDQNALCTNTDGSYTCACKPGYEGTGYECTGMCQDDAVGNYVRTGDVYTHIENGVEMTCTCDKGVAVEGSCISSREEEVPIKEVEVEESCDDLQTRQLVASNDYYVTEIGGTYLRCICNEGRPLRGSCSPVPRVSPLETTTIAMTTKSTTTKATTTTGARRPNNRPVGCFDRRQNVYHAPGETYDWKRGSLTYSCTCTSDRGTSRCRKVQ